MSFPFTTPIQCSEDIPPNQAPEPFQTGRTVTPMEQTPTAQPQSQGHPAGQGQQAQAQPAGAPASSLGSQGLETDAERVGGGASAGGRGRYDVRTQGDHIFIKGQKSTIEAKGLMGAMQPGTIFQLGGENHMTIYSDKTKHKGGGGDATDSRRSSIRNKKPLTTSTMEPSAREMDSICDTLGGDWRRLGRQFNISDFNLDQIRMDYHVDGQHEINYRMLLLWKQQDGNPTLQKLAQALVDIGRGDLADLLAGH